MKFRNKILSIIILSLILSINMTKTIKADNIENYNTEAMIEIQNNKAYLNQGAMILKLELCGELYIYDKTGEPIYTIESMSTSQNQSKVIVPIYEEGEYTFEINESISQPNNAYSKIYYTQQILPQVDDRFEISGHNDDLIIFNSPIDQTLQIEISFGGTPNYNGESGMVNFLNANGELQEELLYFDETSQAYKSTINVKKGINMLEVYLTKANIVWTIKVNPLPMTDVMGHWGDVVINNFLEAGYMNGYGNGTFKPDGHMTRAEFVKTLNKVFNLTTTSGKVFNDTINHWAKNEIDIAVTAGITNGISQTEFAPDLPITREQAAKMLADYKGIIDIEHDKLKKYYDHKYVSDWAKDELEAVLEVGYMVGTPQGYLNPKDNLTRAQAVALLSKALQ